MVHEGNAIQDDELLRLVREMRSEFPEMGESDGPWQASLSWLRLENIMIAQDMLEHRVH